MLRNPFCPDINTSQNVKENDQSTRLGLPIGNEVIWIPGVNLAVKREAGE